MTLLGSLGVTLITQGTLSTARNTRFHVSCDIGARLSAASNSRTKARG